MSLAIDKYAQAVEHFGTVLELDPGNAVAANNRAICWLYICNLTRAIQSLEDLIFKSPELYLHETICFNLCTLYELASDKSIDKKKNLWRLIVKHASDSFNPARIFNFIL